VAAQLGGRGEGAPQLGNGGNGDGSFFSSSSSPRPLAVASGSSGLLWLEWDASGEFLHSSGSSSSAEIAPSTHLQLGIGGGKIREKEKVFIFRFFSSSRKKERKKLTFFFFLPPQKK
jgi:hypothetical protein